MMSAIKIILERIKTNPEEFVITGGANRWMACIEDYWYLMLPVEQTQLREALRELNTAAFNEKVLKTLMAHDDSAPKEVMRVGAFGSVGVGTPRSI